MFVNQKQSGLISFYFIFTVQKTTNHSYRKLCVKEDLEIFFKNNRVVVTLDTIVIKNIT